MNPLALGLSKLSGELWLLMSLGLPLLAKPGRRLLWLLVAVMGVPVLLVAFGVIVATLTEDIAQATRAREYMLAIACGYAVLWLLASRLLSRARTSSATVTRIDTAAVALLIAAVVHMVDPYYSNLWPVRGARLSVASWLLPVVPPLLIAISVAGLWRGWWWSHQVGKGLALVLVGIGMVLVGQQFAQGIFVAGHNGVSFGGLYYLLWRVMFTTGCPLVAWSTLADPAVRQYFKVRA